MDVPCRTLEGALHGIPTAPFTGVVITAAGSKDDLLCPNLAEGRYDSSGTP